MPSAERIDGFPFRILELDPGAVARHAFRNLEERPRNRRAELHHPEIIGQDHPHQLLRLQRRRAENLRAIGRKVDESWRARRRLALLCPRPFGSAARGACRDSRDSARRVASPRQSQARQRRSVCQPVPVRVGAEAAARAGGRGRAARRDAVGAVERYDANFGAASAGSALMRLMRAAPRDVAANSRSSAITLGCRVVIASSAFSGSLSLKLNTSPPPAALSRSASSSSMAPMMTVQGVDMNTQVYCRILRQK